MTDRQYYVRGCTALLDAVGGAIRHIVNVHKYAREEDVPEKTLFLLAFLGGATGGLLGMEAFHHKTKHGTFVWGFRILTLLQLAGLLWLLSGR